MDAIEKAEVLLDQGQITSSHEVLTDEIERLRTLLGKAVHWLSTEHVQDWWKHNEIFQAHYREMAKEPLKSPEI